MDGFHYYRSELDEMEKDNSEGKAANQQCQAHYYRGAYWTFNSKTMLDKIHKLTDPEVTCVKFPSFDHAAKDPEEDSFTIEKFKEIGETKKMIPLIIIIEGLYLLLKEGPETTTYNGLVPNQEQQLKTWAEISD